MYFINAYFTFYDVIVIFPEIKFDVLNSSNDSYLYYWMYFHILSFEDFLLNCTKQNVKSMIQVLSYCVLYH